MVLFCYQFDPNVDFAIPQFKLRVYWVQMLQAWGRGCSIWVSRPSHTICNSILIGNPSHAVTVLSQLVALHYLKLRYYMKYESTVGFSLPRSVISQRCCRSMQSVTSQVLIHFFSVCASLLC